VRERDPLTSLFASPCAQRDTPSEIPQPCVAGSNPAGGAWRILKAIAVGFRQVLPPELWCANLQPDGCRSGARVRG
jgi:hypothetical protein